jgi:serine/threonine protein kinase
MDEDEFAAEPMMESQPSEVRISITHGDENCADMQSPMSAKTCLAFQPQSPTSTATSLVFQPLQNIEDTAESMVHLEKLGCKEHWLIKPQHLHVCPEEVLGRGAFGVVIAGFLHGTRVAVKMPRSTKVIHAMNSLVNEIRILRRCRHPNLVLFHGVSIADNKSQLALVFDKVPGATLRSFIREPPCGPNALERHRLVLDICEALRYLHGQDPQVVHGDIKPENIMVDDVTHARPCAKMLDFGLSRLVTGSANGLGGTLHWMAPEVITGSRPHTSADVFSFGHLVNFIMSGHDPYPGKTATEIRQMACRRETCITVPHGACYDEECKELCEQCCTIEVAKRLNMASAHRIILTWATQNAGVSINSECTPREDSGGEDLKNHPIMQQHKMEL